MSQTFTKLNQVNLAEAYELIKQTISARLSGRSTAKKHMNIYLSGSPGLGKSSIVAQVTDELDMNLIDLRLSAMEESTVLGVPFVADGIMDYSTPQWWKEHIDGANGKPCVLLLDELSSASPQTQTAAYRLVLDRSIQNGKVLPDNVFIIAAGNLKSDKTGARDPLPALGNRFGLHLEIDKTRSFSPFIEWAYKQGFDLSLLAFLEYDRGALYGEIGNEIAFATPRTIEDVNTHLGVFGDDNYLLNIAIAGAVGSEWSHKFSGFRENFGKLPDYEKVKAGDKDYVYKKPEGDIGLDFAIAITAAQQFIDMFGNEESRNLPETKLQGERMMTIVNQVEMDIQTIFLRNMKRNIRALQASRVVKELDDMFMRVTDLNM